MLQMLLITVTPLPCLNEHKAVLVSELLCLLIGHIPLDTIMLLMAIYSCVVVYNCILSYFVF